MGNSLWRSGSEGTRSEAKATVLAGLGLDKGSYQRQVLPKDKTFLEALEQVSSSAGLGSLLENPWCKGGSRDEEWTDGWARVREQGGWLQGHW